MTSLLFVPPERIRPDVWPQIRQRVIDIQVACGEPWLPEDVFNALVAREAFVWATADLSGFLVVQLPEAAYGRELHCWICYNASGEPPVAYWEQLLEIAREHDCVGITFENDRPGFQRAIPGLKMRYLYRAVVPGGDDGRAKDQDDK